ncbi:MAG: energy transducer TonB [Gammaproteobacteria bacterium]|nr:energy transducer TonB [Gammaproteobacteria bacterium]
MKRIILVVAVVGGLILPNACATTEFQGISLVASGDLTFPEAAKSAGITYGVVIVQYDVRTDGTVANAEVVSSDPPGYFEEEALRFVRAWRFRPAHENGQPIELQNVESSIGFELDEDDQSQ